VKRGQAIVLLFVIVVAIIALVGIFKNLGATGQSVQVVVDAPNIMQEEPIHATCCRTEMSTFHPGAKVKPKVRCREAGLSAMRKAVLECPAELNRPIEGRSCEQERKVQSTLGCEITVCCET